MATLVSEGVLLSMTPTMVFVNFNGTEQSVTLDNALNDGGWHQVFVLYDSVTGQVHVGMDTQPLQLVATQQGSGISY